MFHVKHAPVDILPFGKEAEKRLRDFAALLLRWNHRINLIARTDEPFVWERHILDSAQLAPLLPPKGGTLIDLGSGGGFPGLVLGVVAGWRVHLVESDARKSAFLREAIRITETDGTVHIARAESVHLPPADVVTARALASLARLLALAAPLLKPGGFCLFPKGRSAAEELTTARREWHMQAEHFPSQTDATATLLRIREIRPVKPTG